MVSSRSGKENVSVSSPLLFIPPELTFPFVMLFRLPIAFGWEKLGHRVMLDLIWPPLPHYNRKGNKWDLVVSFCVCVVPLMKN